MILALLAGCSMEAQNSYQEWVAESVKLIENNRLDSAASALQNAMSLEPANENNPMLLLNLGVLQRRLHRYDEAYISLTAALAANPDPESVLHNRAALLCELGRFDEAIEDYDSILLKSPQNTEAYYRRGLLYLEKGDRKKNGIRLQNRSKHRRKLPVFETGHGAVVQNGRRLARSSENLFRNH